jgi:hypothetical protein
VTAPRNPELSTENGEHYTPPDVIAAVKHTLGAIDLDPASCEIANRTVGAKHYYTKADSGLAKPWRVADEPPSRVFCNPPGSRRGVAPWWHWGARQWRSGEVDALVFVIFNLNLLQASQGSAAADDVLPLDGALCVPKERIAYYHPSPNLAIPGTGSEVERGEQPTRPSAIAFLPSRREPLASLARFEEAFAKFGAVRWDARCLWRRP